MSFPFLHVLIKGTVNYSDHTASAPGKFMYMEHLWNDTNKGKQDDWDKNPVPVPPRPPQITNGLVWYGTEASVLSVSTYYSIQRCL
jgi:hypothetical protein